MQDHTAKKGQETVKARRSNGIHVVDTARLATSSADALRDAQINLVRAEQTLLTLVQAGHAGNPAQYGAPTPFGFPSAQTIPAQYPTSAYVPGFAPPTAFSTSSGIGFGIVPAGSPWGTSPSATLSPWTPWAAAINAGSGSGHASPAFVSSSLVGRAGTTSGAIGSRALACDILDEGKHFVCQVEMPGVEADQVELLCLENAVAVNAYRETEGDIANLVQSERGNAIQQRVIALPNQIQPGGAKATLSNGILTIVLPKVHPTEGPRRVEVQS